MIKFSILLALFSLLWHGPYHEQIRRINQQLETDPNNPELYLKRAQLYEHDSQLDSAILDYKHVLELDANMTIVHYLCARLYFHHQQADSARWFIDTYLAGENYMEDAKILKAAILIAQDEYPTASDLFEQTIKTIPPKPDYFLQLSEGAYQHQPEDAKQALYWLHRGLAYLPNNLVLVEALVNMATRVGRYDLALEQLEYLTDVFQRKEKWYFKKAEILLAQGKQTEAITALELTLATIDQLPLHIQKTPFILELDTKAVLLLIEHKK